jgi:hypothetical protein
MSLKGGCGTKAADGVSRERRGKQESDFCSSSFYIYIYENSLMKPSKTVKKQVR